MWAVKMESHAWKTKHRKRFVDCTIGVVYDIPLFCGGRYLGKMGWCLNVKLQQQNLNGPRERERVVSRFPLSPVRQGTAAETNDSNSSARKR